MKYCYLLYTAASGQRYPLLGQRTVRRSAVGFVPAISESESNQCANAFSISILMCNVIKEGVKCDAEITFEENSTQEEYILL